VNFKTWLETDIKKEITLLRSVSGAGKSTLAKQLVENGVILSTDDYFMKDGIYDFDPTKLGIYHKNNQDRAEKSMIDGISPIIVDNTFSKEWEMKPYVQLADKYGYEVNIKELPIPHIDELMKRQESRKNINKSLPRETVERMIKNFKKNITVDDVRNS
jgi:NEDD4-binding protein 2